MKCVRTSQAKASKRTMYANQLHQYVMRKKKSVEKAIVPPRAFIVIFNSFSRKKVKKEIQLTQGVAMSTRWVMLSGSEREDGQKDNVLHDDGCKKVKGKTAEINIHLHAKLQTFVTVHEEIEHAYIFFFGGGEN